MDTSFNSSLLLSLTTFAYLGASFLYVAFCIFHSEKVGKMATALTVAALALQTTGLGLRWRESYQMGFGHAPLTNMYESVVFFSWAIGLFYLLLAWKYRARTLGAFAAPLAFLAMAYASFAPGIGRAITPLIPALQSNWLIAHVVTCFIGYAGFAVTAALGFMYLLKEGALATDQSSRLPETEILGDLIHKTMIFGFIWLSAGIITGAIWADSAWGTYWSWDPKETWSLITWFFYAITLHARYTMSLSGGRMAWLAIIGLACVLFTYYGVNFLLSGLHSYGTI
ncbi:MAG: c-type cytochrome biogenesis protein CcsB [Desulfobulbaceae bacterium]|jgi:cytochrome c-type biogenesis protein CcsB|nr:c-type cytochrome biogenesis protein CcsB [Desulfobulbaceae bacterium]